MLIGKLGHFKDEDRTNMNNKTGTFFLTCEK